MLGADVALIAHRALPGLVAPHPLVMRPPLTAARLHAIHSKEILMSNLVSSVRERPDLELHSSLSALSPPSRHVSLADRLSLRLGLWLLLRSVRQHDRRTGPVAHALRLRTERDREARERAARHDRLLRLL